MTFMKAVFYFNCLAFQEVNVKQIEGLVDVM